MAYDPLSGCPDALRARAAAVRLACFDVDGTLTDGGIVLDDAGRESKRFHVRDGLGLAMLRRAGIEVAFVTARRGAVAGLRAAELGVACHEGVREKLPCVRDIAQRQGLSMAAVAFMGDDLADLAVLREAGFAAATADAHPWILEQAHWRSALPGGHGAVREFCDLVLAAQGKLEAVFE